jgi:hypothetical protein
MVRVYTAIEIRKNVCLEEDCMMSHDEPLIQYNQEFVAIVELLNWIELQVDNGNTDISISEFNSPIRGFSAAVCLSDLKKILSNGSRVPSNSVASVCVENNNTRTTPCEICDMIEDCSCWCKCGLPHEQCICGFKPEDF